MKKLLPFISAIFITGSLLSGCKGKSSENVANVNMASSPNLPSGKVLKTLNGFLEGKAATMIFNFSYDGNDTLDIAKKSVSSWYSTTQIADINNLLAQEQTTVDGIRFYLGSENNAAGTASAKLSIHMFMVSTRKRITGTDPVGGGSTHIDYYQHSAAYLTSSSSTPFGDAVDDDAVDVLKTGTLLYGDPKVTATYFPSALCNDSDPHYLDNPTALKWTQRRGDTVTATSQKTGYNTISEWFDYKFITKLFSIITDATHNFSGLRVYLGNGFVDQNGVERDVFILVPTKKDTNNIDQDDYECIAGYESNPLSKTATILSENSLIKKSNTSKPSALRPQADDKGELCPYNCN